MKAIVTGGTGFLGDHLVRNLLENGWHVIVLARNVKNEKWIDSEYVEYRAVDIVDSISLDAVFESVHVVFHCAALSSVWGKYKDFYNVNVVGTKNVVASCEKYNVSKLIYVSSTSVYFDFKDEGYINESHSISSRFANDYARTKYLGEQEVLNHNGKINVVIIRPRGIVGDGDKSIMPRLIRVAQKGYFPLFYKGEALVDVTYVKNVVEGLMLCAKVNHINREIFNISNDQPMKVKDLLDLVFKNKDVKYLKLPYKIVFLFAWLLEYFSKLFDGGEPKLTMYGVGLLAHTQVLDITKAKQILGYSPIYSIEDAVDKYLEWENDCA